MYNISVEWAYVMFFVGFILSGLGVASVVCLVYVNTKYTILKRKIKRKEEETEELNRKNDLIKILLATRTEEKEFFEKSASTDYLTGLHNRENLQHRLKQEIARISRRSKKSILVYFDLNLFKSINDTYGHNTGDQVLIKVAQILKIKLRTQDILFRVGGDEFVIIMPDTNLENSEIVSARLIKYFKSVVLEEFPEIKITSSIGMTDISNHSPDEIIERGDKAMYIAKKNDPERKGSYCVISNEGEIIK